MERKRDYEAIKMHDIRGCIFGVDVIAEKNQLYAWNRIDWIY